MNLTSGHNSAGMEDDAFHYATLAGGEEMLQALGSTGALQGLVCAGMVRVQVTVLSEPMDENSLEEHFLCPQSLISSLHDAKLQCQGKGCHGMASLRCQAWCWHTMFAGPGSDHGSTSPPFVFPLSLQPTSAAEPGTARQQISQQHGLHHPKSSPECASGSQGW